MHVPLCVVLIGFLTFFLSGCRQEVANLRDEGGQLGDHSAETEILEEVEEVIADLEARGLVIENDPVLTPYLEEVADRVYGQLRSEGVPLRVRVLRSGMPNAMAYPNGDIFFTLGLLMFLQTEEEIAFVMAHEAAHVIERHGLTAVLNRRSSVKTAQFFDILTAGIGVAMVGAATEITDYSREQEREADAIGWKIYLDAGYEPEGPVRLFKLLKTLDDRREQGFSFWDTHPSPEERLQRSRAHAQQLAADADYIDPIREDISEIRHEVFAATCEHLLRKRLYSEALFFIEHIASDQEDRFGTFCFYRGEAYLGMAGDPKSAWREYRVLQRARERSERVNEEEFLSRRPEWIATAIACFEESLSIDPDKAVAVRGLGIAALYSGDHSTARTHLEAYLASVPDASDRLYIRTLLDRRLNSEDSDDEI